MAEGLDLGTLTLQLAANVDQLKADLSKATAEIQKSNSQVAKLGESMFGAFQGAAGEAMRFGEKMGRMGESIQRLFGSEASNSAKKLASEIERISGVSNETFLVIGEGLKTMQAGFGLVAVAAGFVNLPLIALGGLVVAAIALVGSLKRAFEELKDESWFAELLDLNNRLVAATGRGATQAKEHIKKNIEESQRTWGRPTSVSEELAKSKAGERAFTEQWAPEKPGAGGGITAGDVYSATIGELKKSLEAGLGMTFDEMGAELKAGIEKLTGVLGQSKDKAKAEEDAAKAASKRQADAGKDFEKAEKDRIKLALDAAREDAKVKAQIRDDEIDRAIRLGEEDYQIRLSAAQYAADQIEQAMAAEVKARNDATEAMRFAAEEEARQAQAKRQAGLESLKGAAVQATGRAGQVAEGFAAGGPLGALATFIATSEALTPLIEACNEIFVSLDEALAVLVEALLPIVEIVAELVMTIMDALQPAFEGIARLLESLGPVVQLVSDVIAGFAPLLELLAEAVGFVCDVIAGVIEAIFGEAEDTESTTDRAAQREEQRKAEEDRRKGQQAWQDLIEDYNKATNAVVEFTAALEEDPTDVKAAEGLARAREEVAALAHEIASGRAMEAHRRASTALTTWQEAQQKLADAEAAIPAAELFQMGQTGTGDDTDYVGAAIAERDRMAEEARLAKEAYDKAQAEAQEAFKKAREAEGTEEEARLLGEAEIEAAKAALKKADADAKGAQAATEFGEALTNVPEGFKIAAARYGAMAPEAGVPTFAEGGYVPGPTLAVVGDAPGGEYIVPAGRMGSMGSGGVTIHIHGITDPASVADAVERKLRRLALIRGKGMVPGAAPQFAMG